MFTWIRSLFVYKLPKGTSPHCRFYLEGNVVECSACNARTLKATGLAPWCRMSMLVSPAMSGAAQPDRFNIAGEIACTELLPNMWPAVYSEDPRYAAIDEVNSTVHALCTQIDIPLPSIRPSRASSSLVTQERRTRSDGNN